MDRRQQRLDPQIWQPPAAPAARRRQQISQPTDTLGERLTDTLRESPKKTRAARRHLLLFPERTLWGIWPQDLRTLWGERGQVLTQGRQHTNTLAHRIGRLFPYRTAQAKPERPPQGDLRTLWGIERRTPRTHGGIGRPTARTLWGLGRQNLRTLRGKFGQNPRTL